MGSPRGAVGRSREFPQGLCLPNASTGSGGLRIRERKKNPLSHLQIEVLSELREHWDAAVATGAGVLPTGYPFRRLCPDLAASPLGSLQSSSTSTARSASPRRCRSSAMGVEPLPSTITRNRRTTYIRWAPQPFSSSPHDGFRGRLEASGCLLDRIIGF